MTNTNSKKKKIIAKIPFKPTENKSAGDNNLRSPKQAQKTPGIFNNIFFYVFAILIGYVLLGSVFQLQAAKEDKPISDVISAIKAEQVQDITVSENNINVLLKDGTSFRSKKESSISFDQILANNAVEHSLVAGSINVVHRPTAEQIITPLLTFGLPILLIFLIFRQMRSASGDIMSFGRSKARMFTKNHPQISFTDVAGNSEAKTDLMEIVDFLKNPRKYRKLGARIPKGVLLIGPAGVGKTLLAKAIAGEANVPFFSVAGSEFMEMLVGVGSARVRDLFKMAQEAQPSLIFIDEIDAIGRQRGMGIGGGHDEREQTLNQILIEMDGFDPRADVIVLAATNRPDMLDPALVRAGRFDRRVTIPMPDLNDRMGIIKIHMRGKPFDDSVNIEKVAKRTVGFSGADIENMLNEAAILAARHDKEVISAHEVEEASLKVTMGAERKTLQSEEDRKLVAYHEAGHAIVATQVKDMDPVHTVSIVARGGSLGHTSFPPQRDRYNETKTRLLSLIKTALGGRAAEELIFNEQTIGASNDIERATEIASKMVKEYGMSDLGPISYNGEEKRSWLAQEMINAPHHSDEISSRIDQEIKKIIDACYAEAKHILTEQRAALDKVSALLLEKETIRDDEFYALLG